METKAKWKKANKSKILTKSDLIIAPNINISGKLSLNLSNTPNISATQKLKIELTNSDFLKEESKDSDELNRVKTVSFTKTKHFFEDSFALNSVTKDLILSEKEVRNIFMAKGDFNYSGKIYENMFSSLQKVKDGIPIILPECVEILHDLNSKRNGSLLTKEESYLS